MAVEITEMTIGDYDTVRALWEKTEGVGLNDADTSQSLDVYLRRNSGLSFMARHGEQIVGAVLCGHDGRRGYLHHLAVSESHRKQGLGSSLVEHCLAKLGSLGILKCNIIVFADNNDGAEFWERRGWTEQHSWRIRQRATTKLT